MILTGKAKEDFYYYVFNNIKEQLFGDLQDVYDYIYSLPISCNHALIIEWFDSVGIYIIVDYSHHVYLTSSVEDINLQFDKRLLFYENGYNTRQEATKQAILKCNTIYNEKTTI